MACQSVQVVYICPWDQHEIHADLIKRDVPTNFPHTLLDIVFYTCGKCYVERGFKYETSVTVELRESVIIHKVISSKPYYIDLINNYDGDLISAFYHRVRRADPTKPYIAETNKRLDMSRHITI